MSWTQQRLGRIFFGAHYYLLKKLTNLVSPVSYRFCKLHKCSDFSLLLSSVLLYLNNESFSFPEAAILLVSTADRDLWPVPIFESAIRGLPVVLRSLRIFAKWRTSQQTSLIDLFHEGHEGSNFGLEILGLGDRSLKKQSTRF